MTDEGEDAIRVWKKNILKALHEAKEKNVTIIRKNMSEIFVKLTKQSERHDEKLTHIDYLRYFIYGPLGLLLDRSANHFDFNNSFA